MTLDVWEYVLLCIIYTAKVLKGADFNVRGAISLVLRNGIPFFIQGNTLIPFHSCPKKMNFWGATETISTCMCSSDADKLYLGLKVDLLPYMEVSHSFTFLLMLLKVLNSVEKTTNG